MGLDAFLIDIRQFFLGSERNYFGLPVKQSHANKIKSINNLIRTISIEKTGKPPTRTHTFFILSRVNAKCRLNLPIGWYKYGPFCVIPFAFSFSDNLTSQEKECVKITANESFAFSTLKLEEIASIKEPIYKTRILISKKHDMTAFKALKEEAPPETRNLIKECNQDSFETLWNYISLVKLHDSLKFYYGKRIDLYLWRQIARAKREAEIVMLNK
jgi:hypothetical protein